MSDLTRREFAAAALSSLAGAAALGPGATPLSAAAAPDPCNLPEPVRRLRPMTAGVQPIGAAERRARIDKAQRLMVEQRIGAAVIEPGTSMIYFTGVRWGTSERTLALVLPARGEPGWICPAFEEARARERMGADADVRVWQEDESPSRLLANLLRDRRAAGGRVGIEEGVRFFVSDGLRHELAGAELVSAAPVVSGCRMYKSPAELALMQRAAWRTQP